MQRQLHHLHHHQKSERLQQVQQQDETGFPFGAAAPSASSGLYVAALPVLAPDDAFPVGEGLLQQQQQQQHYHQNDLIFAGLGHSHHQLSAGAATGVFGFQPPDGAAAGHQEEDEDYGNAHLYHLQHQFDTEHFAMSTSEKVEIEPFGDGGFHLNASAQPYVSSATPAAGPGVFAAAAGAAAGAATGAASGIAAGATAAPLPPSSWANIAGQGAALPSSDPALSRPRATGSVSSGGVPAGGSGSLSSRGAGAAAAEPSVLCADFVAGKCARSACRFLHTKPRKR